MKTYHIWSEGWAATGQSGGPTYHGSVEANSFKEACVIKFNGNKLFNPDHMTHWACRLYKGKHPGWAS